MIWPSCTWREEACVVITGRRCRCLSAPLPWPCPSLAYLDVMALGHHHIFLGKELLHSIRGNDVLYLKGEEAGADSPSPGASRGRQSRVARDTHPINNGNCKDRPPGGSFTKYCPPSSWGEDGRPSPGGRQQQQQLTSPGSRAWGWGGWGRMGAPVRVVSSGSSPGYQTPPGAGPSGRPPW